MNIKRVMQLCGPSPVGGNKIYFKFIEMVTFYIIIIVIINFFNILIKLARTYWSSTKFWTYSFVAVHVFSWCREDLRIVIIIVLTIDIDCTDI